MNGLAILIPIALLLGLCGLLAFFWAMRSGQLEDLDGASLRIFVEDRQADSSEPDHGVGQNQECFPVRGAAPLERHPVNLSEKRVGATH